MTSETRPRHPARKSRIAAMGIGVTAMAGLVGNMEVASRTQSATAASPSISVPSPALEAALRHAEVLDRAKAIALRLPIVLTPHAVVHTVAAPAAPSSGGYVYAASTAHAAAPVASTGGSHP